MRKLALLFLLIHIASVVGASANQKGETAHPTSQKKYTYE